MLADAACEKANFKLTDLRNADLSGADLTEASFESAKVHGVVLAGATLPPRREHVVDLSERGDGSQLLSVGGVAQPNRLSPHHDTGVATAPTSRAKMVASIMAPLVQRGRRRPPAPSGRDWTHNRCP